MGVGAGAGWGPAGEEGSSNWLRSPGAPSGLNCPNLKWQLTDKSPKLKQKERRSFETASLTPRNESKPCTVETEILSHYRETGVSQNPAVGPGEVELAQLLVQSQQGPTSGLYGWAGSRGPGPLGEALSQVRRSGPFLTSWVGERNGGLACARATRHYNANHPVPHNRTDPQNRVGHLCWTCRLKGAWTCRCDFPPTATWLHTSDPLGPLPCRPHPSPKAPFPPQAPTLATNPAPQAPPHRPHPIPEEQ